MFVFIWLNTLFCLFVFLWLDTLVCLFFFGNINWFRLVSLILYTPVPLSFLASLYNRDYWYFIPSIIHIPRTLWPAIQGGRSSLCAGVPRYPRTISSFPLSLNKINLLCTHIYVTAADDKDRTLGRWMTDCKDSIALLFFPISSFFMLKFTPTCFLCVTFWAGKETVE